MCYIRMCRTGAAPRRSFLPHGPAAVSYTHLEKTSITDIANALHVAPGLCYRYFPSKEALFDAAGDQYAELLAGRYSAVLKRTDLTLEQIILQMPGFMAVETDDTFSYKLCHCLLYTSNKGKCFIRFTGRNIRL